MTSFHFFDRDISWLSFNERVLLEAEKESVPLLERFNFLSIYSSNLDEFYRVRIPALMALHRLYKKHDISSKTAAEHHDVLREAKTIINHQLEKFGEILRGLIPALRSHHIQLIYEEPIPTQILPQINDYFYSEVLAFIQPMHLKNSKTFFPENNQLYLAVVTDDIIEENIIVLKVPAAELYRFYSVSVGDQRFICFLEDIIRANINIILPREVIKECYSFKVTRDAELDLEEDYEGDTAEKIEKQIAKRDFGFATRLLYESGFPADSLANFINMLELENAMHIEGGHYHNMKDLSKIPINIPELRNEPWPPKQFMIAADSSLFETLTQKDILIHTPYHSYDLVLRFFNEASIDPDVTEVYTTMYRVARESKIVNALISAAKNGKKVTVLVELKARFDEANNVKWSKKLKAAGVKVIFTEDHLKVHAKIALVKKKTASKTIYLGLLATGNLHEVTARIYTDHILMTSHKEMLKEIESVFWVFDKKTKSRPHESFNHLLVAQFNLQDRFIGLIEQEIEEARKGSRASITIKLNNLEETVLIKKLYEASNAGVKINLIVRSICALIPGVRGMSENITIRRIVDRYLEHGRIFIFHNGGKELVFLGSADWMNRNIYKRIEVCFPVYAYALRQEIMKIIGYQFQDNVQAVHLDEFLINIPITTGEEKIRSQRAIYEYVALDPVIEPPASNHTPTVTEEEATAQESSGIEEGLPRITRIFTD
ncbi:MAG TPA: polyphosphate kinase 1 [Flavitalea sp.]|nr:polyphosphate kinase 1 [Flavitalea sp.]